jgi:hypothetical protein
MRSGLMTLARPLGGLACEAASELVPARLACRERVVKGEAAGRLARRKFYSPTGGAGSTNAAGSGAKVAT